MLTYMHFSSVCNNVYLPEHACHHKVWWFLSLVVWFTCTIFVLNTTILLLTTVNSGCVQSLSVRSLSFILLCSWHNPSMVASIISMATILNSFTWSKLIGDCMEREKDWFPLLLQESPVVENHMTSVCNNGARSSVTHGPGREGRAWIGIFFFIYCKGTTEPPKFWKKFVPILHGLSTWERRLLVFFILNIRRLLCVYYNTQKTHVSVLWKTTRLDEIVCFWQR